MQEATLKYDPVEEQFGFRINEHITWIVADSDIPAGSRGLVVGFGENPDHVKVQFPKPQGTLRFDPAKLEKETMRQRVKEIHPQVRDILPPPPQGPGRPQFRRTWGGTASAPDLATRISDEYVGQQGPDQKKIHAEHSDYKKGLGGLLRVLDRQSRKKKAEDKRLLQTEKAKVEMHRAHKLHLEGARMEKQKPAWTYTDGPGFFETPQMYEQGESKTCSVNKLLTGIYDVTHPHFKPPHAEYGGFNYVDLKLSSDGMALFGDKSHQGMKMTPQERKTKEKLDRSLVMMRELTQTDALNKTTGSVKKQRLMETVGEHSCLKRGIAPWTDQAVATARTFGEYDPLKPGDHFYETALDRFITEPERAMNQQRQIIAGNEQKKSFWNCPKHTMSGTNRRRVLAQELLFRNTRGAAGLRPPSPSMKRKVLLKGTVSLSFTHFKDALLQPMERFSPADLSENY